MSNPIKLVVVGDGAVGKTCLLVVYVKGDFPREYVPTVFDNYTAKVTIEEKVHNIQIWDTAGQEELENIRTLSYAGTSVFVLCYSVVDPATYANITSVWIPEIKMHDPNPTILLVGTKTDLRTNEKTLATLTEKGEKPLTEEDGQAKAKEIGAIGYVECSAMLNQNVKGVFDAGITYITSQQKEGGCCEII